MKIERVDTVRCGVGEGAVWDADENALYFLDVFGAKLFRHDPASGSTKEWDAPGQVGALALREKGGLLLAVKDRLHTLDLASGASAELAGPLFDNPRVLVNDATVDRRGRFVFGGCCAGFEDPQPVGGLFRHDPDGTLTRLDDGTTFSNSHCFSPDGRTLYAADSFISNLYAYDYDLDTGGVSNKRVLINTESLGGVPDGSAVDADGLVWVPIFEAGKIAAVRPDGKLERVVDMPVRLVSSLAWGGPALDVLYVTTIDPTQFGNEAEDGSGHVYAIEGLGTRGVPESRYAG